MKKYELALETKTEFDGVAMCRVRALRDFTAGGGAEVKAGDLGGWVESEANLSQEGGAWVVDEARVCGSAWVGDEARVYGGARVCGGALVYGGAQVFGNARVSGKALVYGGAQVSGAAPAPDG
jgi:carbonic anhydrase/acetyltransferase-like protein (isoleucine patch superfamily)